MKPVLTASFFLLLAVLGFLDATYLTVEHYRGVVPPCSIVAGCQIVTTSSYSLIFNIPVALLGSLYYLAVMVSSILYFDTKHVRWLKLAAALTPFGLAASLWFTYLQWAVIRAWCIYCLGSATTSTLLFVLGMTFLKTQPRHWWKKLLARFGP